MPYDNGILTSFSASKRVSSDVFLPLLNFCLLAKLCPKLLFKPLLLSTAGVYVRIRYYVRPDASSAARAVLTRARLPPVSFPLRSAGCLSRSRSERRNPRRGVSAETQNVTVAVRRILINDAMTVSTKTRRLMVTLSCRVTAIQCKSNTGQNILFYHLH